MGGYGCTEIMSEFLSVTLKFPKTLIGFSDVTALHILFNQKYKVPTIHGAVYSPFFDIDTSHNIIKLLKGTSVQIDLMPIGKTPANNEILAGEVTGGNLTVFCNMIGTKLAPDTENKILIVEDINEKGYHVHRHLVHLKNAGLLNAVKAIIFGSFTTSDEHIEASIKHFCEFHIPHVPTFRAENIGHGKVNNPFILGYNASIIGNNFEQKSPFSLK